MYQGLLRSPASWARVGRGYLKAFERLGISGAAVSPRGFLHDPNFPLPEGVVEVAAEEARRAPPSDIGLGFLHPPLLDRLIGKRKVNLFVWESDRLPPGWAKLLDRGAHLVVVPSAFTRNALVASGLPEAKSAVVPYGFDPEFLSADRTGTGNGASRPFTFLSVISPHWRKGVRELFCAFRQAFHVRDDVLLRVKSTYDPGASTRRLPFEISSWSAVMDECGLAEPDAPRVELDLRVLDDAAAMVLYGDADVLVAPSWGESFGLAILEAMASGRPVIATGWGGHLDFFPPGPDALPYRLEEAGSTLYEPAPGAQAAIPDVDALAGRMRWHRGHPEESRAIGEASRERVAHFTWAAAAGHLLGYLERG